MSAEKLIQIVDEEDKPLRGGTMKEAQKKGLYHRIVLITVEDGHGNKLLQKRGPNVSVFPNCWDTAVAGHVDFSETYEAAAQREMKEELGIAAPLERVVHYKKETTIDDKILNRFKTIYRTVIDSTMPIILQKEEVAEVRWFTVDELRELVANNPNQVADGLLDTLELVYSR